MDEFLFQFRAVAALFMMVAPPAAAIVGGVVGWRRGVRQGRDMVTGWQQGQPLV